MCSGTIETQRFPGSAPTEGEVPRGPLVKELKAKSTCVSTMDKKKKREELCIGVEIGVK